MVIDFSKIDLHERPIILIRNASGTAIGGFGTAVNVSPNIQYNETSEVTFTVPKYIDGEPVPYYDDLVGMRIIEIVDVGRFVLTNPEEISEGQKRYKQCKGYSLEYEWTRKKITIEEGTFKFWDLANPGDTVLGRIMELMPNWQIGYVPASIEKKYRTFEASNNSLYDFVKNTVQESFNCVFVFDTMTRTVNIRDLDEVPSVKPVFLSAKNLAKSITIKENTEDVVTRLDVSGADGVDIRDVNPCGTNKITRLGYYMTEDNVPVELADKYRQWESLVQSNRQPYYTLNVRYSLAIMQKATADAELVDLNGELKSLENIQAVIIQAIAQGSMTQADLDRANENIAIKQTEISAKQEEITGLQANIESIFAEITVIKNACNYEKYFTRDEQKMLDPYIKDDEVAEASFVVPVAENYTSSDVSNSLTDASLSIVNADVSIVDNELGTSIYDIRGGTLSLNDSFSAGVISAVFESHDDGSFVATAYLSNITYNETPFPTGCLTLVGKGHEMNAGEASIQVDEIQAQMYFTLNASEYSRRSVAWDLYEYGESVIDKLSKPGYTFSITSANFFSLEEFEAFKNTIQLGEKVIIEINDEAIIDVSELQLGHMTYDELKLYDNVPIDLYRRSEIITVLKPIFIGVKYNYDAPNTFELVFSDSFVSGDSEFRLVDLLGKTVSMGKTLDLNKYTYSAFTNSGASAGIYDFMNSALDVSKNAITSSSDQAISWDSTGLRLRKWADETKTTYEDEQIWMNSNSMVMTGDNWKTAQVAIGKLHDENVGDVWGVIAQRIVGTMLAGGDLIIESEKQDGGTAVFRVDGEGCRMYNADISVHGSESHITMNPELGLVIGKYPVYMEDENGNKVIDEKNASFWVDTTGNVHIKGTLHGADGEFSGAIMIVGEDGSYFRADNDAIGFYDANGVPLLIQQGGAMHMGGNSSDSGGIIAGNWLYDTNGVRYTHPTTAGNSFRMSCNGTTAYCLANGMNLNIGTDAEKDVYMTGSSFYNTAATLGSPSGNLGKANQPWANMYASTIYRTTDAALSSRRVKQEIKDMPDVGETIDKLRPVTFEYNFKPGVKRHGLIYEETETVFPEICIPPRTDDDIPSINYVDLIPVLLKEVQELRKRVAELEAR